MIAAVPGAALPKSILAEMEKATKSMEYTGPTTPPFSEGKAELSTEVEEHKESIIYYMWLLKETNAKSGMPKTSSIEPEKTLDMFRLAERVRSVGPQITQRILEMEAEISASDDPVDKQEIAIKIYSLIKVQEFYNAITRNVVNMTTYYPQVAQSTISATRNLMGAVNSIVGANPRIFDSDSSWKANIKKFESSRHLPENASWSLEQAAEANDTILAMIKPHTI